MQTGRRGRWPSRPRLRSVRGQVPRCWPVPRSHGSCRMRRRPRRVRLLATNAPHQPTHFRGHVTPRRRTTSVGGATLRNSRRSNSLLPMATVPGSVYEVGERCSRTPMPSTAPRQDGGSSLVETTSPYIGRYVASCSSLAARLGQGHPTLHEGHAGRSQRRHGVAPGDASGGRRAQRPAAARETGGLRPASGCEPVHRRADRGQPGGVSVGAGDGSYGVYVGYDAGGAVASFVADFGIIGALDPEGDGG